MKVLKQMSWYALLLALTGQALAGLVSQTMALFSNNTDDTKFIWLATESAPGYYPMEIIQGEFYYQGEGYGLYIPSGGTLSDGR